MTWNKEQARIETEKYEKEKEDQSVLILFHVAKSFLEPPSCELYDVYRVIFFLISKAENLLYVLCGC